MFRHLRYLTRFIRVCYRCQELILRRSVVTGMLISAAGVTVNESSSYAKLEVNKEELSDSYLMKMASVQAVNSSSALLTQSLSILLDVMDRYIELLGVLVQLMELQLEVFGTGFKEDKVWDAIMDMRKQISDCRTKKLELEAIFSSAEKALRASGEAAHITGAVYAGVAANERLFSATSQLKHRQGIVEQAEMEMHRVEAKCIEKLGKKDKKHVKKDIDDIKTEEHPSPGQASQPDYSNNVPEHNNKQSDENTFILGDIFDNEMYTENTEEDFSSK